MTRPPRITHALVIALAALVPARGHANTSWQGVGALAAGWNSNINNAAPGGGTPVQADGTGTAALGVVFSASLPRLQSVLSYNFAAALFFSTPSATSYSNALTWAALTPTSPTTSLRLTLNVTQSQANAITSLPASAVTPVAVTTVSSQQFVSGAVGENFVWDTSAVTRFFQTLGFTVLVPLVTGTGQTYSLDNSLRLDRSWRNDALGGQLHVNFTDFTATHGPITRPDGSIDPNAVIAPEQRLVTSDLVLRWRHDFGHFWNLQLDAGALLVFDPGSGADAIVQPTGLAALRYLHRDGQAELSYSHGAAPNALTQQTFISDLVSLHGAVPFGAKSHVSLSTTVGYSHSQAIDRKLGNLGSDVDVVLADATLNYLPTAGLTVFARYQYQRQFGGPLTDPTAIPSLERHVVLVGVSGIYPTAAAATVPTHDALRVDGSDVEPPPEAHPPADK